MARVALVGTVVRVEPGQRVLIAGGVQSLVPGEILADIAVPSTGEAVEFYVAVLVPAEHAGSNTALLVTTL